MSSRLKIIVLNDSEIKIYKKGIAKVKFDRFWFLCEIINAIF